MAYVFFWLTPLRFARPSRGSVAVQPSLIPPDANAGSGFNVEFLENVLHMFLDGAWAASQNLSDLVVALSRNDPFDDFELASGQIRWLGLGYPQVFRMAVSMSVPGGHDGAFVAKYFGRVYTPKGVYGRKFISRPGAGVIGRSRRRPSRRSKRDRRGWDGGSGRGAVRNRRRRFRGRVGGRIRRRR